MGEGLEVEFSLKDDLRLNVLTESRLLCTLRLLIFDLADVTDAGLPDPGLADAKGVPAAVSSSSCADVPDNLNVVEEVTKAVIM